ncbi:hypothetical protein OGH69_09125 [Flavobacterium sp. MFBS3-15]|uniref:hypothetical protein n=1 Tax=Flavobacterium sp. MFBS3-15 TaxID=2989816 RepID=UPI00223650B0|nr:hypothetical protein [Flavobacterium sp. MFBS3-15]MCW4469124.1 hypothetical protein [Flavobacterium sp. MFBS3-15]
MGSKKVAVIAENYDFYTKLVDERKSIFSEIIEVNSVGNNANTLETIEKISHPITTDDLTFTINVKLKNYNFFQFKLRYEKFCPQHFFRFDSDGDTHRNKVEGIPFEDQKVPTPHFHKYHESGIEIAYQTDSLLDENERKALTDINLCLKHFFHESNMRLRDDDFSEVQLMTNTLGLNISSEDPNENITFP